MRILITGGSGFIAKNLFEQLNREYNITAAGRQELDLMDSSKVADYLKRNKFDVVIHTATYDAAPKHSTKDPMKVLENNLRMFFNVARCNRHFGKMIYFGSGAEYSREHWISKMKEDYFDQHVPSDQYGFSKYIMAKYAMSGSKIYNLRLFAVFGKYEDWRVRLISSLCHNAALNLPIVISQNKYYDFIHIDDLIKIVRWFINNEPQNKAYNVCSGSIIDFKTIAEKIIKISGKKLDIKIETGGLGTEYSGDNQLLLNEIGCFEFTPIDNSIKKLYEWYEHEFHEQDNHIAVSKNG